MPFLEKGSLYKLPYNDFALCKQLFREENFPVIHIGKPMDIGKFAENLMLFGYHNSSPTFVEEHLAWVERFPEGTTITWEEDENEDEIQAIARFPQTRERQDLPF